jgi:hypothetical protein
LCRSVTTSAERRGGKTSANGLTEAANRQTNRRRRPSATRR